METQAWLRLGMEVPDMANFADQSARNSEASPRSDQMYPDVDRHLPTYENEISFETLDEFRAKTSQSDSLKPLTRYNFNGHTWITDREGRPIFAGGEIKSAPHGRVGKSLQTKIGNEGVHSETDVGFHLIGDQFGGPISRLNVVQGDALLNVSGDKAWENQMRGHLDAGKKVRVRIKPS
jgi:hypothetical protein